METIRRVKQGFNRCLGGEIFDRWDVEAGFSGRKFRVVGGFEGKIERGAAMVAFGGSVFGGGMVLNLRSISLCDEAVLCYFPVPVVLGVLYMYVATEMNDRTAKVLCGVTGMIWVGMGVSFFLMDLGRYLGREGN